MKIKTSELTDAALDYAVSLITNPEWSDEDRWHNTIGYVDSGDPDDEPYMPSEDWLQGGPITEHNGISLFYSPHLGSEDQWKASLTPNESEPHFYFQRFGHTPLIAAMRCFVASKLGNEVEIPEELI